MERKIDDPRQNVDTLLRVLIVEDNPDDADILRRTLSTLGISGEVVLASTREEFEQAVSDQGAPVDVALADYSLGQFTALDVIRYLRERKLDTPVVVVTGFLPRVEAVKLVRQGAAWWVMKGDLSELGEVMLMVLERRYEARQTQQLIGFLKELAAERPIKEPVEQRVFRLLEEIADEWRSIRALAGQLRYGG